MKEEKNATNKIILERQILEEPAIFVWDHKEERCEINDKYDYYLISKIDPKAVITQGAGSKCVHNEDEEKYQTFIMSEDEKYTNIRLLHIHEDYIPVQIKKDIIRDDCNEMAYTIIVIKTIYSGEDGTHTLASESNYDELTGLLSRASFESFCKRERKLKRDKHINVIGVICVDQYCSLKKQLSTNALDEVIVRIANTIKDKLKPGMILSRYWEDSFLVCYHDAPSIEAANDFFRHLADNVCTSMGDSEKLTISIGTARCRHDKEIGYMAAFNMAREGLHDALRKGGAKSTYCSESFKEGEHVVVNMLPDRDVFIRMFGNFDVFINGKPILFPNKKSKELFALLVAHRGGFVSTDEIIGSLWENEPVNKTTMSRCRKIVMRLKKTLAEYGIEEIVVLEPRQRRVDTNKFRCDYYEHLNGNKDKAILTDSFLKQYSWAEVFMSTLEENLW